MLKFHRFLRSVLDEAWAREAAVRREAIDSGQDIIRQGNIDAHIFLGLAM
jgi:hypothetical protein